MLNSERPGKPATSLMLQGQDLTISDVHAVAVNARPTVLSADKSIRRGMQASADLVREAVAEGWRVYGVTTGFGSMAGVAVPGEFAAASQMNLLSFLATGAGTPIDKSHVRAAMVLRGNMLLRGVSGVRVEIVERLVRLLDADAIPVVRELGSIGASGDLVPLASIARAITGHGECLLDYNGRQQDGPTVLHGLGLSPLALLPKEALAIVNGTSFSAAIAANCVYEARQLMGLSLTSHAIMIRALCGYDDPFLPFVHECKPHPGQVWTAETVRELLNDGCNGQLERPHLQDRYSLRCLPQYFGPIVEGLARVIDVVETEMNSITDNPLICSEDRRFYQSGNFLGQYIGMAMDDLRTYLSLLAKHLDVQIAQLVSPEFSNGLPASLQGNSELSYNMGLKGLQITGNSIMPLLTQAANPLVPHYPTHAEQHNQNINGLSWGAANLAWRSVQLYRHYTAAALIFAVQAIDLRAQKTKGHFDGRQLLGSLTRPLYEAVYDTLDCSVGQQFPLVFNDADTSLERCLDKISDVISNDGAIVEAVSPVLESFDQANL